MEIYGLIILIFLALLLIGIVFKLAKFVFKLASLVLLFVVIIWIGLFIFNLSGETSESTTKLYVVELNDSYNAYTLSGENYTFVDIESDEALETLNQYDSIYLISYETLRSNCVENTTLMNCVQNVSLEQFWKKINMTN